MTPEEHFAGHPVALAAYAAVHALVEGMGGAEVRTTTSQVAAWLREAADRAV